MKPTHYLVRRFDGDKLVREELLTKPLEDCIRVNLEQHYRLDIVELAPCSEPIDFQAIRWAEKEIREYGIDTCHAPDPAMMLRLSTMLLAE